MQNVPITNVPNQSFSIQLEGIWYDFTFRMCATAIGASPFYLAPTMAVDIVRDNVAIVTGQRCVANFWLIPYRYLEQGNFFFVTDNDDLPDWNQFGITQFLMYATVEELAAAR